MIGTLGVALLLTAAATFYKVRVGNRRRWPWPQPRHGRPRTPL